MAMVYDLPTADATAQPMQQFQAPESKNVAAEQAGQMGTAITTAGGVMTKIAHEFENDLAEAATRERINQLSTSYEELISNPETGYLTKNSKAAVDSYKDTAKSVDDIAQKIGEGAATDLERGMYKKLADKYKLDAKQKIYSHAINQGKVWNVTEATKGVENAVDKLGNDGFKYVGTPEFTKLITSFDARLKDLARVTGIPEGSEAYKASEHDYRSKYNHQIIDKMIITPGFTEAAKEYYYANKKDIDDPKGELLHRINSADDDLVGNKAVDTAWKGVMGDGKDYNAPVKDNDLFEALRTDPTLDSKERRAAAEQKMHLKIGNWNKQQGEINQKGEDDAWSLYNSGKTLTEIKASASWGQMGGERRGRFEQTYESIQAAKSSRAAAIASRNQTQIKINDEMMFRKNATSYYEDSDPANLRTKSRSQVVALIQKYGTEHGGHLVDKWDALQKHEEGLQVLGTEKVLKIAAQNAGIIPKTGKPSDAQQDQYNRLELETAKRVKLFELTNLKGQRKANEQELQSVVDGVLLDKAKVGGFWSDTEKPVALMTKSELANSKVVVGGQDVYLSKIPAPTRMKYIQKLDAAGIPATEQRVAEMYVADQKPSGSAPAPKPSDSKPVQQKITAPRPAAPVSASPRAPGEVERIQAREKQYQEENSPRAKEIAKAKKTGANEYITATKADGTTVRTASKNAKFNESTLKWEVK